MIDISTVLIWVVATILWGITVKISNKHWLAMFGFGFNVGMLLTICILYVLGGK